KCGKDAREFFQREWSVDKDTMLLDYSNHYSNAYKRCFMLVEWHYRATAPNNGWFGHFLLYDVYEHVLHAEINEFHEISAARTTVQMLKCEANGTECKSQDEFHAKVRPYMTN